MGLICRLIALFDPAVTDDQIRRALAELELLEWVEALPGGLEARLAASGDGMSAGEAQLLAFARLVLRDPGLVTWTKPSWSQPVWLRARAGALSRALGWTPPGECRGRSRPTVSRWKGLPSACAAA